MQALTVALHQRLISAPVAHQVPPRGTCENRRWNRFYGKKIRSPELYAFATVVLGVYNSRPINIAIRKW
jgi:hypothetical protein